MERLARKLFPGSSPDVPSSVGTVAFLNAIEDSDVQRLIRLASPATVRDALAYAQRVDAAIRSTECASMPRQMNYADLVNLPVKIKNQPPHAGSLKSGDKFSADKLTTLCHGDYQRRISSQEERGCQNNNPCLSSPFPWALITGVLLPLGQQKAATISRPFSNNQIIMVPHAQLRT